MIISNEFTITRPIDEAWAVLTDIEGIAPCMPGAQLTEVEGDTYRGLVKVKIGPIQAKFSGEASFSEQDEDNHRAVLVARGKEATGKGVASATVTASLSPGADDGTTVVSVETDLSIAGKIAQFGRSAMSDVSIKLMTQFAERLEEKMGQEATEDKEDTEAEAPTAGEEQAEAETLAAEESESEPAEPSEEAAPERRVIDSPEAEPVDLVRTAGAPLARNLIPVLVVVALLVIVVVFVVL